MIVGYFAAKTQTEHGHPPLACVARELWESIEHTAPSVVDGAIVFYDDEGKRHARIVALDLFRAEPLRAVVFDASAWARR